MEASFYVGSEVGRLRRVMLHRPGKEIERVTIENKEELLFDDLVWTDEAQKEHDAFAELLVENGVEVVYFGELFAQSLKEEDLRRELLSRVLRMDGLDDALLGLLLSWASEATPQEVADLLIAGATKREVMSRFGGVKSLVLESMGDNDFVVKPTPNLYFQRDPAVFFRDGVVVSRMSTGARRKEAIYVGHLLSHHPYFSGITLLHSCDEMEGLDYSVEGGDVLVLSEGVLAVGVSQRTTPAAVDLLGKLISSRMGPVRILAVEIPRARSYMHLDTVFTMVDREVFMIYPGVQSVLKIWAMDYAGGRLESMEEMASLEEALRRSLGLEALRFVETGGGDPLVAAREQWNDGTNTLAIAPGVVVTYRRNRASNQALREAGIKVFEIRGNELVRGRGGPRCMSMPMLRDGL